MILLLALSQSPTFWQILPLYCFSSCLTQIWVIFLLYQYLLEAQNQVLCLPYRIPGTPISLLNCCSCHYCSWIFLVTLAYLLTTELPRSSSPLVFSFCLFLIHNFLFVKPYVSSWSLFFLALSLACFFFSLSLLISHCFSICSLSHLRKSISFHAFF